MIMGDDNYIFMKNMDPDNAQLYKRDYVQKYIRKTEPYHVQKYEKKNRYQRGRCISKLK